MKLEQLIRDGRSGVYRFLSTSSAAKWPPLPGTTQYRFVDTGDVSDKAAFLKETSAALRFPDYFGGNWDAFYDCLTDCAEQAMQGLVVVFTDLSALARQQPEAFKAAIAVMNDAATFWKDAGKQLLIMVGVDDPALDPQLPDVSFL